MDWRAIPEGHEAAGHLAQQMSYNSDPIVGIEGAPLAMEIQLAPGRDSADSREVIARPLRLENGMWPTGA